MGYVPSKYGVRFVHGISFCPQYNYLVGVCIFILVTTIKTNVLRIAIKYIMMKAKVFEPIS